MITKMYVCDVCRTEFSRCLILGIDEWRPPLIRVASVEVCENCANEAVDLLLAAHQILDQRAAV